MPMINSPMKGSCSTSVPKALANASPSTAPKMQLFIPRGFAHGFLVLSDEAVFTYKVDNAYAPESEACIRFDDPQLAIQWPIDLSEVLTSEKDLKGCLLKDAETFE